MLRGEQIDLFRWTGLLLRRDVVADGVQPASLVRSSIATMLSDFPQSLSTVLCGMSFDLGAPIYS
jgi:hypothetical protein